MGFIAQTRKLYRRRVSGTFVRLRELMATHKDLARKLDAMERKYDARFRVVFTAIRKLMEPPPEKPRRAIGFEPPKK